MHKVIPILALFSLACSTARITRFDGEVVEGSIDSADATHLNVSTNQGKERVARSDIEEIVHPGVEAMWLGGISMALGLGSLGAGAYVLATTDSSLTDAALPYMMFGGAAVSVGLLVGAGGLIAHQLSEANARAPKSASLSPLFLDAQGQAHPGFGVSWRF